VAPVRVQALNAASEPIVAPNPVPLLPRAASALHLNGEAIDPEFCGTVHVERL